MVDKAFRFDDAAVTAIIQRYTLSIVFFVTLM